jgi:hypothetical protein
LGGLDGDKEGALVGGDGWMMGERSGFAPTFLPKSGEELGPTGNDVICFLWSYELMFARIFSQEDIRDDVLIVDTDMLLDIIFYVYFVDPFLNVLLGLF